MFSICTFIVTLSAAMPITIVNGFPRSQFYPFGTTATDNYLPANDDGSTSRIPISVPFPFFGSSYSSVYVSARMLEQVDVKYNFSNK